MNKFKDRMKSAGIRTGTFTKRDIKGGTGIGNKELPISLAVLTHFHQNINNKRDAAEDRDAFWQNDNYTGYARKIVLPADKLFEDNPLSKDGVKQAPPQQTESNFHWSNANSFTVRYRVPVRQVPRLNNLLSSSEALISDAAALYMKQNPLITEAIEYINSFCNSRRLNYTPSKFGNLNTVSDGQIGMPQFSISPTKPHTTTVDAVNVQSLISISPRIRGGASMESSSSTTALYSDYNNAGKRHKYGCVLTSDREIPEASPATNSGTTISIIPLRDHELYQALKMDVKHYLSTIITVDERHSIEGGTKCEQSTGGRLYRSQPLGSLSPTNQEISREYFPVSKSTYVLYKSDLDLQRMSVVLPDHTIEQERQWHAAAMVLQGFWKIILAKRLKNKMHFCLELEHYRRMAAEVILRSIKDYLACKDVKHLKNWLHKQKDQCNNIHMIQSVLRYLWSVDKTREKMLQLQLQEKLQRQKSHVQHLSSCLIQAIYRGYVCRMKLNHLILCVVKLQRFWRIFLAYKQVRLLVFKKRTILRSFRRRRNNAARIIQRFGIRVIMMKRAEAELAERKRRLNAYLKNTIEAHAEYWLETKDVDEEFCVALLHRVSKGMQSRIRFNVDRLRFYKESAAAFIIQRTWRSWVAYRIFIEHKAVRSQEWANKCCIENVKVAAIDIQAAVRRFLARKEYNRRKVADSWRRLACCKIQSFVRSVKRKQVLRVMQEEKAWRALLYLRTATRVYSATMIQAFWRGKMAREMFVLFRKFILQQRPIYVGRIQRAVRTFLAKCRCKASLIEKQAEDHVAQQEELKISSATRIQATWRMHAVTSNLTIGRCTHPTFLKRKAAIRIQTKWRGYVAKSRKGQLTLANAYISQELLNQEHLYVYASKIQAVIRSKILNRRVVETAMKQVAEKAVRTIQRNGRLYIKYSTAKKSAERDATIVWNYAIGIQREEAAVKIQSLVRMRPVRTLLLRKVNASARLVRWVKVMLAKRKLRVLRLERETDAYYLLESEMIEAAQSIQRFWRKYSTAYKMNGEKIVSA